MRIIRDMEIFDGKDLPDWVMGMETDNLNDPESSIANIGLRLPEWRPCERASKLVLCRWPGDPLVGWNWDFQPLTEREERVPDSCAVIYFAEKELKPGEKREPGFTYGFGRGW